MSKKEDKEVKKVFERARQMKKYSPAQKSLIVKLAQEAALSVLEYYGCDPEAQKLSLSNESHRNIIARAVGQVLESKLILKGLI